MKQKMSLEDSITLAQNNASDFTHAYATTELEGGGMQHIVKQLGYGDDPLNQRASVGWKAVKTAERLSEQYMVRIESCSARYSAKALAN